MLGGEGGCEQWEVLGPGTGMLCGFQGHVQWVWGRKAAKGKSTRRRGFLRQKTGSPFSTPRCSPFILWHQGLAFMTSRPLANHRAHPSLSQWALQGSLWMRAPLLQYKYVLLCFCQLPCPSGGNYFSHMNFNFWKI